MSRATDPRGRASGEDGCRPPVDQLVPLLPTECSTAFRTPTGDVLYLRAHWVAVDGSPVCVGIEVWKNGIPGADCTDLMPIQPVTTGLQAVDLRGIPFGRAMQLLWEDAQRRQGEARREVKEVLDRIEQQPDRGEIPFTDPAEAAAALRRVLDDEVQFGDKPRRGDDIEHFEKVAAVYRAATPHGTPTKAVQNTFNVSYSTATKWAARCRDLNLLAPTSPGYASRPTTPPRAKGRK